MSFFQLLAVKRRWKETWVSSTVQTEPRAPDVGAGKSCYQFSVLRAQMISVAQDISNAQGWITVSLNNFPESRGSVCSKSQPGTQNPGPAGTCNVLPHRMCLWVFLHFHYSEKKNGAAAITEEHSGFMHSFSHLEIWAQVLCFGH